MRNEEILRFWFFVCRGSGDVVTVVESKGVACMFVWACISVYICVYMRSPHTGNCVRV